MINYVFMEKYRLFYLQIFINYNQFFVVQLKLYNRSHMNTIQGKMTKLLKMPFFELFQNTLTFKRTRTYLAFTMSIVYILVFMLWAQLWLNSSLYMREENIGIKKMNFANILYIILFINVTLACKSAPPKEEVATTTTTTGKSFQET